MRPAIETPDLGYDERRTKVTGLTAEETINKSYYAVRVLVGSVVQGARFDLYALWRRTENILTSSGEQLIVTRTLFFSVVTERNRQHARTGRGEVRMVGINLEGSRFNTSIGAGRGGRDRWKLAPLLPTTRAPPTFKQNKRASTHTPITIPVPIRLSIAAKVVTPVGAGQG